MDDSDRFLHNLAAMQLADPAFVISGYDVPDKFRFDSFPDYFITQYQAVNMEFAATKEQCEQATITPAKLWLIPEPSSVNLAAGMPGKCCAVIIHPDPDQLARYLADGSSCVLASTAAAVLYPFMHQHWGVKTITKSAELKFSTIVATICFTDECAMPEEWSKCLVNSVAHLGNTVIQPAEVYIRPLHMTSPAQQIKDGLLELRDEDTTVAAKDFRQILIGRRLHTMGTANWYQSDKWTDAHFDDITRGLQEHQLEFMKGLKSMPGSLAMVKGPPGTGKTTIIKCITRSALIMGKKIAVSAATDRATNIVALTCKHTGAKVCRFTSMNRALNKLEEIALRKAEEHQKQTIKAEAHLAGGPVEQEEHTSGNRNVVRQEYGLLADLQSRATKGKDDTSIDSRLLEEQPECVTLKRLGLYVNGDIPSDLKPTADHLELEFLSHWRKMICQGFTGAGTREQIAFRKVAKQLIIASIKKMDVVAGVSSSFPETKDWLRPIIDLSIADEANQALEPEVVAFFTTFISRPKILIGDDLQLQPTVITRTTGSLSGISVADEDPCLKDELRVDNETANPFARQLEVSVLRRISVYFPYSNFDVQYRSVPQIVDLFRHAIYRGLLEDHHSTAVANRPEARKFQAVLEKHWGVVGKSVLVLDVHGAEAIDEPGTTSKINPLMKNEGIKVLKVLEDEGFQDVQCMSPYSGQKRLYTNELGEGVSTVWTTVDDSQSSEAGIVVLDLTDSSPDKGATAFAREYTRLNVALSRARDGLIILGSSAVGMLKELPQNPAEMDPDLFYDYLFTYAKAHGYLVDVVAGTSSDESPRNDPAPVSGPSKKIAPRHKIDLREECRLLAKMAIDFYDVRADDATFLEIKDDMCKALDDEDEDAYHEASRTLKQFMRDQSRRAREY